ncbi:MAG TPA: hypothetical protein VLE43_10135 [Candidatus Saccharimonadia bacterium]|nr:hypothetical protein [Candidatus Saccharimonadia bacterium]
MHSEEPTTSHRKRHPWKVVAVLLLVVAGWMGYMLSSYHAPILTLPDGSSLRFLDATKAVGSTPVMGAPLLPPVFESERAPEENWWYKLWMQLPEGLQDRIPPPHGSNVTVSFQTLVPEALWFKVDGTFDSERWRFFWVDDRGYETEARAYAWPPNSPLLAFEGCVPRHQKQLHLRVRERDGEKMADPRNSGSAGQLGEVVGDFHVRNPLLQKTGSAPLQPDPLPATAPVHGDKMVLAHAVRSRITSIPTLGMRFDMHLNGHEPITSKYQLHDWVIEDASGNLLAPINGRGCLYDNSHWWAHGLWSNSPAWKVRFIASRYLEKHFEAAEKFTLQRMPVLRSNSTTDLSTWQEEHMVKGHLIRVYGVGDWGPGRTSFRIDISPPIDRNDLIILSTTTFSGKRVEPDTEGHFDSVQQPELLDQSATETSCYVMFSNPPEGDHVSFTFGLEKPVPVEFTFQPEFEP